MPKKPTFEGGVVFKKDDRVTISLPIEPLPLPPRVTIPLLQHGEGIPARLAVNEGDHVSAGQTIGVAYEENTATVHASIPGKVTRIHRDHTIARRDAICVEIEHDGSGEFASPIPYDNPWNESTPEELLGKITQSGIVDGNGTPLPLHTRLSRALSGQADTIICSTVADEPFAAANARLLIESAEKVATGIRICQRITGAKKLVLALNTDTAGLLAEKAEELFGEITVVALKPKYPQHDPLLLVYSCLGRSNSSAVVLDASTMVWLRDAMIELSPCMSRVVTVAGPLVRSPKNLLVPMGTPIRALLEACDTTLTGGVKLVSNSLLSGSTLIDLDQPVTKTTSALLALEHAHHPYASRACIGCRRCQSVCPMRLAPARLALLARRNDPAEAAAWHLDSCIECGSCAYVCPSKQDIVHQIRLAKLHARRVTTTEAA